MKKIRKGTQAGDAEKVTALVTKLNRYRHEYYNLAAPSVPDAVYDHLFDELQELEKQTGIILSNSPTQTVGAAPVSSLKKVEHTIPLLSLDKTKQMEELLEMAGRSDSLLMLKLDGLTVEICYENGRLVEASTRGDGETGELVTHNIPAFYNVPVSIPHKGRLVVTGEGIIHQDDFEKIKGEVSDGRKEACNARNLAAGSIRLLYPAACRKRHIHFYAFNVIEGMEGFGKIADSRGKLLEALRSLGFEVCPFLLLTEKASMEELEKGIRDLRDTAEDKGLPIDGMVLRYDSLSAVQARAVMNIALRAVKIYCEQGYNSVSCTYVGAGEITLTFSASQVSTEQVREYRQIALDAALAARQELYETGKLTEDMTEKEKAAVYFAWICDNCVYDAGAGDGSLSHIPYNLFQNGTAVCDGYTGAYNLFLKLEGIDCTTFIQGDHIWTVATLDGSKYHIDTTWGDSGSEVSYEFFAMTPQQSQAIHARQAA